MNLALALCLVVIGTTDSRYPVATPQSFGSITTEVAMKMQFAMPCPPNWLQEKNDDIRAFAVKNNCKRPFDFSLADERVGWAKANGYQVWGHTLVWAYQHSPFLNIPLPAEDKERVLREFVTTSVRHFCYDVAGWDVINEYWDSGLGLWADIPDLIPKAFKWTNDSLDECGRGRTEKRPLLYFNNGASCYDSIIAATYIVMDMRKWGVKPDGVAAQCHLNTDRSQLYEPLVSQTVKFYNSQGLRVRFSEVDIQSSHVERQAEAAKIIYRICRQSHCDGVTFWGQDDATSWLTFLPHIGTVDALPFDRHGNVKYWYSEIQADNCGVWRKTYLPHVRVKSVN